MNVQLISLAVVLAVLVGCPDTPPEAIADVARQREEIAISRQADAESAESARILENAKSFDH